jgi:hypothetical protein
MDLSTEELVLINNALNEILNGPCAIDRGEFQLRTGVEVEEAQRLLSRIGSAIDARHAH